MKRILYSLFYILALSLSLGELAVASPHEDDVLCLQGTPHEGYFYDDETSSDPGDVIINIVTLALEHQVTVSESAFQSPPLYPTLHLADARGPPQVRK